MSETENMDRTVTEDGGQPGQITEADIDGVEDNRDGLTEGVGEPHGCYADRAAGH